MSSGKAKCDADVCLGKTSELGEEGGGEGSGEDHQPGHGVASRVLSKPETRTTSLVWNIAVKGKGSESDLHIGKATS